MNDEITRAAPASPGVAVYLIVFSFLMLLTAMELTVFYVEALKPVLVPLLVDFAATALPLPSAPSGIVRRGARSAGKSKCLIIQASFSEL
jgi:hypothetical protein